MPTMDNLMNNKAVMLGLSVLAFLIAAVLVILIFRMLFGGRLRMSGGRARQARLGIVDAFDLDRQRQLIIVRRDNTEHLIMIGGPNDLVIESEIVRAEIRDLRDQRRDPVTGDTRIPAPAPALDKAVAASIQPSEKPPLARPPTEPRLPAPSQPIDTRLDAAPELPRAPTFPLPPRRPAAAERRPATPPKLPESVSRGEEVPAFSGQPSAPAPAPPIPVPPPAARSTVASGSPFQSGPASVARPPFLKPLAPRPPARALQRTTPQGPAVPGAGGPSGTGRGATSPQSNDALESLEEEMAKLLGRGS